MACILPSLFSLFFNLDQLDGATKRLAKGKCKMEKTTGNNEEVEPLGTQAAASGFRDAAAIDLSKTEIGSPLSPNWNVWFGCLQMSGRP